MKACLSGQRFCRRENPGIAGSKFSMKSERHVAHLLVIELDRLTSGLAKIIVKNVGYSAAFDTLSGRGVIHAAGSSPQFAAARAANHSIAN
jgi:hypothetical protein